MRILMHVCCAPDATTAYLRLKSKGEITMFYYNPNIQPYSEYTRRLEAVEKLSRLWKIPLIVGEYNVKEWYSEIKGHEHEGEGSERCFLCMRHRLIVTAREALKRGFDAFSTSLPTSPNKIYDMILRAGKMASNSTGIPFIVENFRKNGGYPLSVRLSKELGLYRQNYCGCYFSLVEVEEKRKASRERRRKALERLLKDLGVDSKFELDPKELVLREDLLKLSDEDLGRVLSLIRPRRVLVDEETALSRWRGRRNLRFGKYKVRLEVLEEGRRSTLLIS